jgi:hypothetical protein
MKNIKLYWNIRYICRYIRKREYIQITQRDISIITKSLKLEDSIIDMWCGTWSLISKLINRGYRTKGIDSSFTAKILAHLRDPRVSIFLMDLNKMTTEDNYNVWFLNQTLVFIFNKNLFLRERKKHIDRLYIFQSTHKQNNDYKKDWVSMCEIELQKILRSSWWSYRIVSEKITDSGLNLQLYELIK